MANQLELRNSFINHLIAEGFREEVARDIVNEFHLKFPFTDYRFSDCYKFLIDYCDTKLESYTSEKEYNYQADVVELCILFGLRADKTSVFVNSGLITGPSTLKAYVTLEFLKTGYPKNSKQFPNGEFDKPICKKIN